MKMNRISHEACCKWDTPALFLAACLFSLALVKQDKHVGSDFFLSAGFTLVAPSAITENQKKKQNSEYSSWEQCLLTVLNRN